MVLSKLLEKLISSQLRNYLDDNGLLPPSQSAYRPAHSTETALLKLTSDVLLSQDRGKLCLLCSLDLTAAFDTIDHDILVRRLHSSFGVSGTALSWLCSFVTGRSQTVIYGTSSSSPVSLPHGVPQGSVLGPLLFILYTSDLPSIAQQHHLTLQSYADDVQFYGFCDPAACVSLTERVSACLDTLTSWFNSNRLQLNINKSDFMWCASNRRKRNLTLDNMCIEGQTPTLVSSFKCLGVIIDSDLSFSSHVGKTVSSCFAVLRRLRSIRRCISRNLLKLLVTSLVLPRLDYCISVLHGIPNFQLRRLQSILNASARLIFNSPRFSSAAPLLDTLRWLPVQKRIDFRLAVMAFNCRQGLAPKYLWDGITNVSSLSGRSRLRSSSTAALVVPLVRHRTLGGRAFRSGAVRVWNSLPSSIANEQNPKNFKALLKAHFLPLE